LDPVLAQRTNRQQLPGMFETALMLHSKRWSAGARVAFVPFPFGWEFSEET
jgi:hypothetical protein